MWECGKLAKDQEQMHLGTASQYKFRIENDDDDGGMAMYSMTELASRKVHGCGRKCISHSIIAI
jgi:hypothetical protein